jgi:hypothetical protein
MNPLINRLKRVYQRLILNSRVRQLTGKIAAHSKPDQQKKAVVFFNASARLEGLNLNAAFSLISSWGVQLAGRKVYHFDCRSGMSRCVLGAGLGDPRTPPPCRGCIRDTARFTRGGTPVWFDYHEDGRLREITAGKSVGDLEHLEYQGRPLGQLVLPSLRWILRRHHLLNDESTRYLYSEYILSAHNIAEKFCHLLDSIEVEAVVVFNGLQYPEAVVRWTALQRDIRVITHEVNLQPFSAFFTDGQATIYPLNIPESFQLTESQDQLLDQYLASRFRGEFKMAGIKFWSAMDQLPQGLIEYASHYEALVPVFTNVIFDTSQAHANTIFPDMFDWLDLIHSTAQKHVDTLFIIRAHPDEMRQGKKSRESVMAWAEERRLAELSNIRLIGPGETISSYELIQRSKFTLVYNSSIGLEAALLGVPVLCAGKARYTQYPTVFYPESRHQYEGLLESFLSQEEILVPPEFVTNARRFLFFQLFRASLPFGEFLSEHATPGYVQLKPVSWEKILPGGSPTVDCIVNGILDGSEFYLETE